MYLYAVTHCLRQLRHNASVAFEKEKRCIVSAGPLLDGMASLIKRPFLTAAGFQKLTSTSLPSVCSFSLPLRDPSASFRGTMRCKSIKRVFAAQSMSQWESLPPYSGAANFSYSPRGLTYGCQQRRDINKRLRRLHIQ